MRPLVRISLALLLVSCGDSVGGSGGDDNPGAGAGVCGFCAFHQDCGPGHICSRNIGYFCPSAPMGTTCSDSGQCGENQGCDHEFPAAGMCLQPCTQDKDCLLGLSEDEVKNSWTCTQGVCLYDACKSGEFGCAPGTCSLVSMTSPGHCQPSCRSTDECRPFGQVCVFN